MLAEVDDANVLGELVLDELARRVRQQNLAAVARAADARAPVDAHADVALAADERLTGVDAHAYANGDVLRP